MTNVQQEVEQWKDVPGFEGFYMVSDFGRVLSLERIIKQPEGFGKERTNRQRVLKLKYNKKGYPFVVLHAAPKRKLLYVHRMVMLSFVGFPPKNKQLVLHSDDNPSNCRLSNLRYGSSYDNMQDASNRGRLVHTKLVCSRSVAVYKFSEKFELLEEYKSLTHAAKENGVFHTNISQAIKNGWPCAGYRWSYSKEPNRNVIDNLRISVSVFDENKTLLHTYRSISEAVREFKITRSTILKSHNKNRKTIFGHYWQIAS